MNNNLENKLQITFIYLFYDNIVSYMLKNLQESSRISDDIVEAQPLWEYPGIALTEEEEIASISMLNPPENILEKHGVFNLRG